MSSQQNFDWPDQETSPEQSSPQQVVTTVKNIISTLVNKTYPSVSTVSQSQLTSTTVSAVPTDTLTTIANETTASNILTTVTEAISTTFRSIVTPASTGNSLNITETFNSNGTVATSSSNTTLLTEVNSNSTMSETTIADTLDNITTEPVTSIVTETMRSIIDTTENVVNITSNATNTGMHEFHDNMDRDDLIVYIILGVLLGLLIIIFVALFVFYKRYKRCRQSSGDYCVTQLKEVSSSASIKTTSDLNDISVKH